MKNEIEFTAYERRVLELPQKEKLFGKEAEMLRKIIDTFPWMLTVADCRFDPIVAHNLLIAAKLNVDAENLTRSTVKNYEARKK